MNKFSINELHQFDFIPSHIYNPMWPRDMVLDQKYAFVSKDNNLVGIIILDKIDKNWSYIIMKNDDIKDTGLSIDTEEKAVQELLNTMNSHLK